MFGNGIHLADVASKSAGYCHHEQWDGEAVLLLCEADVRSTRMQKTTPVSYGHDIIQKFGGVIRCIQGLGRTGPLNWIPVGWQISGAPAADRTLVSMVC